MYCILRVSKPSAVVEPISYIYDKTNRLDKIYDKNYQEGKQRRPFTYFSRFSLFFS